MESRTDYIEVNKALWTERTKHHIHTGFYDIAAFKQGKNSLDSIVLDLLGDIAGKDVVHLQCHFGQDTLSLARLGAKATGIDFAEESIRQARELATACGLEAQFICSDVHEADRRLAAPADIVFTSYGVLGWLPDMHRWAQVVSRCLKPGGTLVLAEFHPVVWMYDNGFTEVAYSYFNRQTIIETEEHTYTDTDKVIALPAITWNHPLTDVITALLQAGLRIDTFREFDYSPYPCFQKGREIAPGRYQIEGLEGKLPMVYAIRATKL